MVFERRVSVASYSLLGKVTYIGTTTYIVHYIPPPFYLFERQKKKTLIHKSKQ